MKKEISIKNHMDELLRVNQFVEEIGEELGLDMELQMNLNLVMEEMVVNVISYAYPEGTEASIELLAESDGKCSAIVARSSTLPSRKVPTWTRIQLSEIWEEWVSTS